MTTPADQQQRLARRRRTIRLVLALASFAAGMLCAHLPEHYQGACRVAAKIVGFFLGGG